MNMGEDRAHTLQECYAFKARGIVGTGEGFDAPSAGKVGGRWPNSSIVEGPLVMLQAFSLSCSCGSLRKAHLSFKAGAANRNYGQNTFFPLIHSAPPKPVSMDTAYRASEDCFNCKDSTNVIFSKTCLS